MKVIDLQYITHCTNDEYQLITIHGADDMLIHIKLSKTLTKRLLKQKNKAKSIKTRVNQIQQASLLPNGVNHHMTSNLIKEWSLRTELKKTIKKTQSLKGDNNEKNKEDNKEDTNIPIREEWRQKTCKKTWPIPRRQHSR